jgi:hypothetical protein
MWSAIAFRATASLVSVLQNSALEIIDPRQAAAIIPMQETDGCHAWPCGSERRA